MTKKEQLQDMLTPANWDELEGYVNAAAHNEYGPDREITDQFYEDAVNEIIQENQIREKIMKKDHLTITDLQSKLAELRAKIAQREQEDYDRRAERPQ